nr:MAG TPA: hypothetical protein [Caudoviricetes sp.]
MNNFFFAITSILYVLFRVQRYNLFLKRVQFMSNKRLYFSYIK